MEREFRTTPQWPIATTPLSGDELVEIWKDGKQYYVPFSELGGIPAAHQGSHQRGGSDAVGTLEKTAYAIPYLESDGTIDTRVSDASATKKGKVQLATDGEESAKKAVTGTDARLSDARAPTAHAEQHIAGTDVIADATVSNSGLMSAADKGKADATIPEYIPTEDQKAALAGTSGTPGAGNKYVTNADGRLPTTEEKAALVGSHGTPGEANPFVTTTDPRLAGGGGATERLLIGDPTAGHMTIDENEIQAKANGTTPATLYLNKDGGRVECGEDLKVAGVLTSAQAQIANTFIGSGVYLREQDGFLIKTDIPPTVSVMTFLEFTMNAHTAGYPCIGIVQCYHETGVATLLESGYSAIGDAPPYCRIFFTDNVLCFWIPKTGNYQTLHPVLHTNRGPYKIVSTTAEALPASRDREVTANVLLPWSSINDGPGSGLDADTVDGSHYNATDILTKLKTVDGPGSGLAADTAATADYATSAGSATTATSAGKLTNARTITVKGNATGSVTFDGSANKTLTLEVTYATLAGNAINATIATTADRTPNNFGASLPTAGEGMHGRFFYAANGTLHYCAQTASSTYKWIKIGPNT